MEGGREKEEREERGERGGEGGREENGEKEELWDSQPACQAELSLPLQGFSFCIWGLSRMDQSSLKVLSSPSSTSYSHIARASLLTE